MPTTMPAASYEKPNPLPVFATLKAAIDDSLAALKAMPAFFAATFVMMACNQIVAQPLLDRVLREGPSFESDVYGLVNGAVTNLLVAPIVVALHRFAILRETSTLSSLAGKLEVILVYVGLSLAPSIATVALSAPSRLATGNAAAVLGVLLFIVNILLAFWIIRFILTLPAIAVEAPNATLGGSARATKGVFWRLLFLLMLAMAIPLGGGYALSYMIGRLGVPFIGTGFVALGSTITVSVVAMALSHAYIWRSQGPHGRGAAAGEISAQT